VATEHGATLNFRRPRGEGEPLFTF
jgi:hypothetical protein